MNPQESQCFLRSFRLLRGGDFRRVLTEGHRQGTAHLVVHLLVQDLPHSRLGVTLPRRIGGAVARNRVRRHLREAFRRQLRVRLGSPCADIVVRAESGAGSTGRGVLAAELLQAVDSWLQRGRPLRRHRRRSES
jgi:ribonuclease P protein component